jgi:integrase
MGVKVRERKGAWWLFIDYEGKRKARRVGTGPEGRKAAKLAAEKIQAKLALGDRGLLEPDRVVPSFKEASERWLTGHSQMGQIRPSTQADYARTLRMYACPPFGNRPVTAITREDVRGLLVHLLSQGKSRSLARNLLAPIRQTSTS